MKYCLSVLMLFLPLGFCSAQSPSLPDSNYRRPYLLIDGKRADPLSLMVLNRDAIKSLIVLSPEQAAKYGKENTRFGAVEISTVKPNDMLTYNELLDFFQIKRAAAKLPLVVYFGLFFDRLSALEPDLFVASLSGVQSIAVGKRFEKDFKVYLSKVDTQVSNTPANAKLDSLVKTLKMEAKRRVPKDQLIYVQ